MKSETNARYKVQARIGCIAHDSYLFFPRELGDLLLEPGDEVILVAKSSPYPKAEEESFGADSDFFDKVKENVAGSQVMDRLTNKTGAWMDYVKEAIANAKYGGGK